MGIYWSAAFVLNFPGFPLRWLMILFWPIQLLLLLRLFTMRDPAPMIFFVVSVVCFGGFWRWNIYERQRLTYLD
jgi:hypothetical protein